MEKLKTLFQNKKILLIILIVLIIIITAIYSLLQKSESLPPPENITGYEYSGPNENVLVTESPELAAAINDQKKVDQEYGNWQDDTRNQFPWRKSLPLYSDNYYVYFDIENKKFIGLLYPGSSESTDNIKQEILKVFREEDIPQTQYEFDWKITPKP